MTLRNAIDKDVFLIENISYSDNDFKAMSIDELETIKMLITKKLNGLSLSLDEIKNDGFNSVGGKKRAQFINKRVLEYVNYLLKNHRNKTSLAECFFASAKEILPPMLFEQILNEAQICVKANLDIGKRG